MITILDVLFEQLDKDLNTNYSARLSACEP